MSGKSVLLSFVLSIVLSLVLFSPTVVGEVIKIKSPGHFSDDVEYVLNPHLRPSEKEKVVRLSPLNLSPGIIDTLSWRTLTYSWSSFGCGNPGDSIAIWFVPSARCTLEAIRIHFGGAPCGPGNILLDVCGSRYDGHITTTDSTDANGWIGNYEGGRWNPGWVLGRSPVGEHIWGPFPLSMNGSMLNSWVEVSTSHLNKPDLKGEPFFVTMAIFPFDKSVCITMENQNTVPFHLFKYYAECCGPDGVHNGWFIRNFSIWVEAIVSYYENTPPEISDMDILNDTFAPGPYTVEAEIEDRDAEDPNRAGIASVHLRWNANGIPDSTIMTGPSEGGTFSGRLPSLIQGDVVEYFITATDKAGTRSVNTSQTFSRLRPENPRADILFVNYHVWFDEEVEFYRQLLDSLGYVFEYWDADEHQGIDESVSSYGWRTAIVFGYNEWIPSSYLMPPIPTREYGDNIWAQFLSTGVPKSPMNLFYAESWYCILNNEDSESEFRPGDFAYDYFGCAAAEDCDGWRCTDRIFYGVSGDPISGDFTEVPMRQTWPLQFAQEYWIIHTTASETGVDIFFTESGDTSGLRCDGGLFKTVYLPWDFYQLLEDTGTDTVPSSDARKLMKNVLEWFGTEQEVVRGDINGNGLINVLDILLGANIILGVHDPTPSEYTRVDCDGDRQIDITDLVGIVNIILGIGTCPP